MVRGKKEKPKPDMEQQPDKLKFTLSFQLFKITEELLAEVLASGYEGYVGIIAEVSQSPDDNQVVLDVKLRRLGGDKPSKPPKNSAVFHVAPSKGAKRIV